MTEKPSFRHNFMYYAMYFMTLLYVAVGAIFLTADGFEWISDTNRKIVGFLAIAYGIFRMYVLRKRYRR